MKNYFINSIAMLLLLATTISLADGLRSVTFISHNACYRTGFHPGGQQFIQASLNVEYEVSNQGPNHICKMAFTSSDWAAWDETHARFNRMVDGKERWTASADVSGPFSGAHPIIPRWQYSFSCTDLTEKFEVNLNTGNKLESYGLSIAAPMETVTNKPCP